MFEAYFKENQQNTSSMGGVRDRTQEMDRSNSMQRQLQPNQLGNNSVTNNWGSSNSPRGGGHSGSGLFRATTIKSVKYALSTATIAALSMGGYILFREYGETLQKIWSTATVKQAGTILDSIGETMKLVDGIDWTNPAIGAVAAFVPTFFLLFYGLKRAYGIGKKKVTKGLETVSLSRFNKLLGRGSKEGSRITVAGVKIPKEMETLSFFFWGKPGVGKTQSMLQMAECIKHDKAIIYEVKAFDFAENMIDEDDMVFSLDMASQTKNRVFFDVFSEARTEGDIWFEAAFLFPKPLKGEPIWVNTAQQVYAAVRLTLLMQAKPSLRDFIDFVREYSADLTKLGEAVEPARVEFGVDIRRYLVEGDKASQSIMISALSEINKLTKRELYQEPNMSFRKFLKDDSDTRKLYIQKSEANWSNFQAYYTLVFAFMLREIKNLTNDLSRKTWIFVDEIQDWGNLSPKDSGGYGILDTLAVSRSKGACFVLASQSPSKMADIYNDDQLNAFMQLTNLKFIFQSDGADGEFFSRFFGKRVVSEKKESTNLNDVYGLGANIQESENEEWALLGSEIASLKKFEAYIASQGALTKVKTKIFKGKKKEIEKFSIEVPRFRVLEEKKAEKEPKADTENTDDFKLN